MCKNVLLRTLQRRIKLISYQKDPNNPRILLEIFVG